MKHSVMVLAEVQEGWWLTVAAGPGVALCTSYWNQSCGHSACSTPLGVRDDYGVCHGTEMGGLFLLKEDFKSQGLAVLPAMASQNHSIEAHCTYVSL